MNRKEHKLLSFKANNFFDIEKLFNKNPELYSELCEKYPVKHKECVFAIIYKKEEVEDSKPKKDEVITETVIADGKEVLVVESEPKVTDFPEDFQPLYKVGEKLRVRRYNGNDLVETIAIEIKDIRFREDFEEYVYLVEVLSTGELLEYNEELLVEVEV